MGSLSTEREVVRDLAEQLERGLRGPCRIALGSRAERQQLVADFESGLTSREIKNRPGRSPKGFLKT